MQQPSKTENFLENQKTEWKSLSVCGYPKHMGSNTGLILNIETKRITFGCLKKRGYYYISLRNDKGIRNHSIAVHQLICWAFHGPPPTSKHTPDHRDTDSTNNSADNLRWATKSEQIRNRRTDRFRPGRPVTQMDLYGNEMMTWFTIRDASRGTGIEDHNISYGLKSGSSSTGYLWKYCTDNIEGEEWSLVPGNLFAHPIYTSNKGRIFDAETKKLSFGGSTYHDTYRRTFLKNKEDKNKQYSVHVLIMLAFKGPCPEGQVVNHIDGNKRNNKLENLEYNTLNENAQHAHDTGLQPSLINGEFSKPVKRMDYDGNIIGIYPSMSEAFRQTGTHIQSISCVCSGKNKTSNNSLWAFIEVGETPIINQEALLSFNEKYKTKRVNAKKVNVYGIDGVLLATFPTIKEASVKTNISTFRIKRCCKIGNVADNKFTFRYAD